MLVPYVQVEINDLQMQQHQLQSGSEKLDSIFTEIARLQVCVLFADCGCAAAAAAAAAARAAMADGSIAGRGCGRGVVVMCYTTVPSLVVCLVFDHVRTPMSLFNSLSDCCCLHCCSGGGRFQHCSAHYKVC